MSTRPRIIFHVGGPEYHPSSHQASVIIEWLGEEFACHKAEGLAAFEHLNECDLLVLMGMHWSGWGREYRSPTETHRRAFERYVASGRPILAAHAAIASYDDWPRFGELVGFTWIEGISTQLPPAEFRVRILPTRHPVISNVSDYTIMDEMYQDLVFTPGLDINVHAIAEHDGRQHPMVITAEGGRIIGAGKTAYLANGHDMRAFECPAMRQLWLNTVAWCLAKG
ncbi:ThuA domain-containing protein [Fontivita pretiosa]|uniref:ThuA domain-containing protein n=1 Tax=Fontivita pretiosa TaxID=2989684 RepID=UPI003D183D95